MTPYLHASRKQHDACETSSRAALLGLDSKIGDTLRALDSLLLDMDRLACCHWGCHELEHVIEQLVGRSVSYARSSWRLAEIGHYDESLALTRTIAEIANLSWLFFSDDSTLREWIDASRSQRISAFGPGKVRKRLEALGAVIPVDADTYSRLCEVGIHPNPESVPQSHNRHGIPTLGGHFQEAGLIDCLLLLATSTALVAGPAAKLAVVDRSHAERIVESAISLLSVTASVEESTEVFGSSDALLKMTNRKSDRTQPPRAS